LIRVWGITKPWFLEDLAVLLAMNMISGLLPYSNVSPLLEFLPTKAFSNGFNGGLLGAQVFPGSIPPFPMGPPVDGRPGKDPITSRA